MAWCAALQACNASSAASGAASSAQQAQQARLLAQRVGHGADVAASAGAHHHAQARACRETLGG